MAGTQLPECGLNSITVIIAEDITFNLMEELSQMESAPSHSTSTYSPVYSQAMYSPSSPTSSTPGSYSPTNDQMEELMLEISPDHTMEMQTSVPSSTYSERIYNSDRLMLNRSPNSLLSPRTTETDSPDTNHPHDVEFQFQKVTAVSTGDIDFDDIFKKNSKVRLLPVASVKPQEHSACQCDYCNRYKL